MGRRQNPQNQYDDDDEYDEDADNDDDDDDTDKGTKASVNSCANNGRLAAV